VRGIFSAAQLRAALRPSDLHLAPTRLLAVENTHNRGGGAIWPLQQLQEVCSVAREAGIHTHLDGARLWNASAATGIATDKYAKEFDSVSVCFSKGLGAPVGSVLAGDTEFVKKARRFRTQFGGGMRQAGIIAAAALHALAHHRERLADDHTNARQLALGLSEVPGISINIDEVETNMVYFDVAQQSASQLAGRLQEMNVLVLSTGVNTVRAVTNLTVEADDITRAIDAVREVMTSVITN
jgi:threonine aldolase